MEVIKCADCKWCKPFRVSDESGEPLIIKGCALNHFFEVEDYFFCSDGERKKRMNKENAERIVSVLDAIDKNWSKVSEWRFGQLISNLESCVGRDLFYMTDDDFIKLINSYFDDIDQWTEEEYNEGSHN